MFSASATTFFRSMGSVMPAPPVTPDSTLMSKSIDGVSRKDRCSVPAQGFLSTKTTPRRSTPSNWRFVKSALKTVPEPPVSDASVNASVMRHSLNHLSVRSK